MDYTTFYEVTNEIVDISTYGTILLSLGGFWIFYRTFKKNRNQKKEDKNFFSLYFGLIFGMIFCVNSIIGIPKSYEKLEQTKNIYRNGYFKVIKGKIKDFESYEYIGAKPEKFKLNGVPFEYSYYEGSYYGFQITSSKGGPIMKNGQEVRLSYITDDYERNIILKLELKK